MYSRLIKPPTGKSFFLFGPRGTGKSTWVRSTFPRAAYLDLLEAELYLRLAANPQRLAEFIPKGHKDWVVLDEVQKVPDLLNEVHRLIENERLRFVLTGSSARKLRRRSVNLLAGRALTLHLHPLTAAELGKDFDLNRSLLFGHLPSACTEPDPKAYLQSYVKTYLQEEVQQEGLTRNIGAFSRFLEAASFSQASVVNTSSVARECSVERKVVDQYFTILEDLLLASFLPVFSKRAKRRIVNHPKFYFFDAGVYRTLRPKGPLDRPEEIDGHALETLFFQELRSLNDYLDTGCELFYWRTASGLEVDFVLYGEAGILAFEVKREGRARPESLRGLKAFLEDYPQARAYYVYGGNRRMREGEIEILPLADCLKSLPQILTSK